MSEDPDTCTIRAARCTIPDRAVFLKQLQEIAAAHDVHIICFNRDLMAGRIHAETAIRLAGRAFRNGENISNTLEMEALLFAAGSRQCNVAASFGIHKGDNNTFVCCCPSRAAIWQMLEKIFDFTGDDDQIDAEKRERLMKTFGISANEMRAAGGEERLCDLILERVALLQVQR